MRSKACARETKHHLKRILFQKGDIRTRRKLHPAQPCVMHRRSYQDHHTTIMILAFIDFSFETLLWGVLALLVVYLARQIFTPPPPPPRSRPPPPKPVVLKEYSKEELLRCTGADPSTPILIGIKGKVYDVSRGRSFYGPGCAYPCLLHPHYYICLLSITSFSFTLFSSIVVL